MTDGKQAFMDMFKEKLLGVYKKIADHGDAPAYEKGVVQGVMITGRAINIVTKEELQNVIDQERLRVFGTIERSVARKPERSSSLPEMMFNQESLLDIPTFLRNKNKTYRG